MKVIHFARFGPQQSGLYETAHDLILAERKIGIDAQLIDFDGKEHRTGMTDRGVEAMPMSCADDAHILVRHSAIPTKLQYLKPVVMAVHGRPESSFRLEQSGEIEVITGFVNKSKDARYKAFVTFWEEHVEQWKMIIPNISYVPSPVDLEAFNSYESPLESPGTPNVLIADMWRSDVTPFNMIFAAAICHAKYLPRMQLHIVGLTEDNLKVIAPYLRELKRRGLLGHVAGTIKAIKDYYALADILITPHVIATRIIREASAMDVDIVAGTGCKYTPYQANPMDIEGFARQIRRAWCDPEDHSPRQTAEKYFDPEKSAKAMLRVFESVLEIPKSGRKVFIDLGAHVGQTTRRFYREVSDASMWDIFCFEPSPESFSALGKNVGFIPNVNLINKLAFNYTGQASFWEGNINAGDGSTAMPDKLTGRLNTSATKVEAIRLIDWMKENIQPGDYVVVKANVEGAEYMLMDDLAKNGQMKNINQMYINTHAHKFPEPKKSQYEKIEKDFKNKAKREGMKLFMAPKGEIQFQC